jgi:hypothetical protein
MPLSIFPKIYPARRFRAHPISKKPMEFHYGERPVTRKIAVQWQVSAVLLVSEQDIQQHMRTALKIAIAMH